MSDFHPISLFYLAREMLPGWFWPLVILALLLLAGVWLGFRRLRRSGRSPAGPLMVALLLGLASTAIVTLVLPYLTHASLSVFGSLVDFIVALGLSSLFGLGVFAAVFAVAAFRVTAAKRPSGSVRA